MKSTHFLFFIAALTFTFASCSIEKRRYLDGYHVEWYHQRDQHMKEASAGNTPDERLAEMGQEQGSVEVLPNEADQKKIEVTPTPIMADVSDNKEKLNRMKSPARISIAKRITQSAAQSRLHAFSYRPDDIQSLSPIGTVLGFIAFGLAILATISFIIGLWIAVDWAALGWIAIAVVMGVATLLFTIAAQGIFWHHHQGVPWFMWLPLFISAISLYPLIRIAIERIVH